MTTVTERDVVPADARTLHVYATSARVAAGARPGVGGHIRHGGPRRRRGRAGRGE